MSKIKSNSIVGKKFGRLLVLDEYNEVRSGNNRKFALCKCECGEYTKVRKDALTSGGTKSCGCLREEREHGMWGTRFYNIWDGMKQRCQNLRAENYDRYGGRGIKLCDDWQDFRGFYEDMYESYEEHVKRHGESNTSIDRIDNDGNYEPSNCRWATWREQSRNQRLRRTNMTGYTGVYQDKETGRWVANITLDDVGIQRYIFDSKEKAIKVRRALEACHYGTIQIKGKVYEMDLLIEGFYSRKNGGD